MPRDLSQKDIDLLKLLAPECKGLDCAGSGASYRSILPPLANHFASDEHDFRKRLEKLSTEDLQYLLSLTKNGDESLNCVPPRYLLIFIDLVNERLKLSLTKESFFNVMGKC
ncbi:MAG: hypothetical protein WBL02_03205 [Methanomethylovorans sp.]|uniref:hypothetical protein n=1 Tax=Methanomethylovorans sp. TaxID=2758717 RepID=UPI000B177699|nr:hypothetical protein [Methanomethylovorans sp.]